MSCGSILAAYRSGAGVFGCSCSTWWNALALLAIAGADNAFDGNVCERMRAVDLVELGLLPSVRLCEATIRSVCTEV